MGSKLFKIYSECHYFLKTYWRSEGLAEKTLSIMGVGVASYYLLKHGARFLNYLRPTPFSLPYRYGSGSWVVITGATSPLGKAFAMEFATRGFSICLVGKSEEKLEALRKEVCLINQFINTKVIVADFKQALLPSFFQNLSEEFKNLDVSILVNNASVDFFDYFAEANNQQLQEVFCVNMLAVVMITQFFVNKMLARKFCSAVINVSSCEGVFPYPFVSVYSASKAFIDAFSSELGKQLDGKVDVLALRPYWIRMNLPMFAKKILTVSAENCVKSCLAQLSKGYTTYGHPKHALIGVLKELQPEWVRNMSSRITKPLSIEEKRKVSMRYEKRRRNI